MIARFQRELRAAANLHAPPYRRYLRQWRGVRPTLHRLCLCGGQASSAACDPARQSLFRLRRRSTRYARWPRLWRMPIDKA
jgi:hypothetical protein